MGISHVCVLNGTTSNYVCNYSMVTSTISCIDIESDPVTLHPYVLDGMIYHHTHMF